MVLLPRRRPRLGPKWQLLTTVPWQIEKVLNSVNCVIQRVGGRDRRAVHVDRLQRYEEAAQDDTKVTSQPRPGGSGLTSQPRPGGNVLTSQTRQGSNVLTSQPRQNGNVSGTKQRRDGNVRRQRQSIAAY